MICFQAAPQLFLSCLHGVWSRQPNCWPVWNNAGLIELVDSKARRLACRYRAAAIPARSTEQGGLFVCMCKHKVWATTGLLLPCIPYLFRGTELETYWDYKQASHSYQQAWQQLHTQAFPQWPRSDRDLLMFRWREPVQSTLFFTHIHV